MNEARENVLISRIVDNEITEHEWRDFQIAADLDPTMWRELAQTQREHHELVQSVTNATGVAESIIIPRTTRESFSQQPDPLKPFRLNHLRVWSGWAVAAMVAIFAGVQFTSQPYSSQSLPSQVHQAGFPLQSAAEAFQAYLDKGRESGEVVGEVPERVLVESKPTLSGKGVEVIYLRQVIERAIVPDLYQFGGQDEIGRPTLVRYVHPVRRAM